MIQKFRKRLFLFLELHIIMPDFLTIKMG